MIRLEATPNREQVSFSFRACDAKLCVFREGGGLFCGWGFRLRGVIGPADRLAGNRAWSDFQ